MSLNGEASRHVVVFDCNIYLDAARLLGEPFAWNRVRSLLEGLAAIPVPHPHNEAFDSLQALRAAYNGRFGDHEIEVWTSSRIDRMVRTAAARSGIRDRPDSYRGLGWTKEAAEGIVEDLIHGLVGASDGGFLGQHCPDGNLPLDYEDSMIYEACGVLADEDPLATVYCVTRDREFLEVHRKGMLPGHSRVIPPSKLVEIGRQAALRRMRRRG